LNLWYDTLILLVFASCLDFLMVEARYNTHNRREGQRSLYLPTSDYLCTSKLN
jgi:hypothetical protein